MIIDQLIMKKEKKKRKLKFGNILSENRSEESYFHKSDKIKIWKISNVRKVDITYGNDPILKILTKDSSTKIFGKVTCQSN